MISTTVGIPDMAIPDPIPRNPLSEMGVFITRSGNAREQILAASGKPDQLMREDRVQQEHAVRPDQLAIDAQVHGFRHQSCAEGLHFFSAQHANRFELPGVVPGMVEGGDITVQIDAKVLCQSIPRQGRIGSKSHENPGVNPRLAQPW